MNTKILYLEEDDDASDVTATAFKHIIETILDVLAADKPDSEFTMGEISTRLYNEFELHFQSLNELESHTCMSALFTFIKMANEKGFLLPEQEVSSKELPN